MPPQNPSRSLVRDNKQLRESDVFPTNQRAQDVKQAENELNDFVTKFLKCLVKAEGERNSSLQVFCRIDVGIFAKAPNTVSYFVNEVERGITTSLWVTDGNHTAGMVGMTIVQPLKKWIAAEKVRIATNS